MDWIAGLPTTAAGFDIIQNHVDLLFGRVYAVPTRATATAADAATVIRDMCLRSGAGFPDVLVVDHDGPRGFFHPPPLPSRRGGMIGGGLDCRAPDNGGRI